jgi:serine/threonine protein phosphatase PrpC
VQNNGSVVAGRLGGRLAVARALGDFEFKVVKDDQGCVHQLTYLSIVPEVTQWELDLDLDEFIVIGSDGLFEKLSNQEICDFISKELDSQPFGAQDLKLVADRIVRHAEKLNVSDNVTCLIVGLKRGNLSNL